MRKINLLLFLILFSFKAFALEEYSWQASDSSIELREPPITVETVNPFGGNVWYTIATVRSNPDLRSYIIDSGQNYLVTYHVNGLCGYSTIGDAIAHANPNSTVWWARGLPSAFGIDELDCNNGNIKIWSDSSSITFNASIVPSWVEKIYFMYYVHSFSSPFDAEYVVVDPSPLESFKVYKDKGGWYHVEIPTGLVNNTFTLNLRTGRDTPVKKAGTGGDVAFLYYTSKAFFATREINFNKGNFSRERYLKSLTLRGEPRQGEIDIDVLVYDSLFGDFVVADEITFIPEEFGDSAPYRFDATYNFQQDISTNRVKFIVHLHHSVQTENLDDDWWYPSVESIKLSVAIPPIAFINSQPYAAVNQKIIFDGSKSYDPDGNITYYEWNLGDGSIVIGGPYEKIINHSYSSVGIYTVTLTVTDNDGARDTQDIQIKISAGQPIFVWCGNSLIDEGEDCDGNNLGNYSCLDFNFSRGNLSCNTSCQFDTSNCSVEENQQSASGSSSGGGGGGGGGSSSLTTRNPTSSPVVTGKVEETQEQEKATVEENTKTTTETEKIDTTEEGIYEEVPAITGAVVVDEKVQPSLTVGLIITFSIIIIGSGIYFLLFIKYRTL